MKSITVKLLAMAVLMSASVQSFGVDLECEPNDKRCQKEEYKITIYKQGRDEYEKARKSGDFTRERARPVGSPPGPEHSGSEPGRTGMIPQATIRPPRMTGRAGA